MSQPKLEKNKNKPIADQVVEEIEKRKEQGLKTYGEYLRPFNNRDALQDSLEEVLDLACYIKQSQLERQEMVTMLWHCYNCCNDYHLKNEIFDFLLSLGEI